VEKIPVFHAGQALQSLFKYGRDKEKELSMPWPLSCFAQFGNRKN
jgi:hypothetical protein